MPVAIDIIVQINPALLRALPPQPYLEAGMQTAVELVRDAAERNLSGGKVRPSGRPRRSSKPGYGPLRGSVTTLVVSTPPEGVAGYIRSGVFYGRFLETGAVAHPIEAWHRRRRAAKRPGPGMLAFGPMAGPTFRRKIMHPGIQPRYWMRSAAEQQGPAVVTLFERQIQQWTQAVTKQFQATELV